MKEVDNIKDLFNEKLGNFEATVRPDLWSNISSQISVNAASTSGGLSVLAKTAIGFTIAASVAVVGYLVVKDDSTSKKPEKNELQSTVQDKEASSSETINNNPSKTDNTTVIQTTNRSNDHEEQIYNPFIDKNVPVGPVVTDESAENNTLPTKQNENSAFTKENENSSAESGKQSSTNNEVKENTSSTIDPEKVNENTTVSEDYFIAELPNFFSPNGDGINEVLSIESRGLVDFNIVILDQHSKIVYKSNQPDFVWDGVGMNGLIVPEGNYLYYITARDSKGKFVNKHSYLRVEIGR